jgi:acyl-[acyl-carrier-protein]-phospholipid O-acyltransferase/long-chain-fatty-acid--[acyl-carrier-protein] ligase
MRGYLKNETKTKEVIRVINGKRYYMSGDKGYIDEDGFVYIVDRYSRFAKIGGEMISLGAVEEAIYKLIDTSIAQIAVTSIPDSKKGEKIVLLLEGEIEIDNIKATIKCSNLHPLQIPSCYIKIDKIPKLGTGKCDFKRIKEIAIELSIK